MDASLADVTVRYLRRDERSFRTDSIQIRHDGGSWSATRAELADFIAELRNLLAYADERAGSERDNA